MVHTLVNDAQKRRLIGIKSLNSLILRGYSYGVLCFIKSCLFQTSCWIMLNEIMPVVCHRGVVGRVPAFQSSGPGSISGGVWNFNSYSGTGSVSFLCSVLCCLRRWPLHHGCASHDTEGKRFKSPVHCCDVTKPPYLFSGELCTFPLHCKLLFVYTECCRCTGQCSSVLRTRKSDVILTSGRQ